MKINNFKRILITSGVVFLLSMHLLGCVASDPILPLQTTHLTAKQNICIRDCNENDINCDEGGTYSAKECMACKAKCVKLL